MSIVWLAIGWFGSSAFGAPVVEGARLVLQPGHTEKVVTAVFSADGTRVATGGEDGVAIVWHAASGAGLQRLEGHDGRVGGAAFSPDGARIVTYGDFRQAVAIVWDPERGARLFDLPHDDTPEEAAFTPDGARIAVATADGTAALWDAATGALVAKLAEGEGEAGAASRVSADGSRVMTLRADRNQAQIWDTSTAQVVARIEEPNGVIYAALSRDGKRLFTTDRDNRAKVWDAATGALLRKLKGKPHGAKVAAFSADGQWVGEVSSEQGGPTMVWSVATGKVRVLPATTDNDRYVDLAFTPDGRVVTSHGDRTVRVHDAATGAELRRFTVPGSEYEDVKRVVVSPDGAVVVAVAEGAGEWDLSDGHLVHALAGAARGVRDATFSADGRRIATANLDPTATLWDLVQGSPARTFTGAEKPLWTVAFSADGEHLATAGQQGRFAWWSAASGEAERVVGDHEGPTTTVAVSPDGSRALTGGLDGRIHEINTASGTQVVDLDGMGGNVIAARYSADGSRIWTASYNGVVTVRDRTSGNVLERMELGEIVCAAFSPDGRRVLAVARDGFQVRDVATSKVVQAYKGDVGRACAFSPDGARIAIGSWAGAGAVYSLTKAAPIAKLQGHSGEIYSVEFSPDGKRVLTGSNDGTSRLWDASTGREQVALMSFSDGGWAAVDPEGRFDASEDGRVSGLVWVIDGEPYALDQLREQYYEPGLVAKVLGARTDPLRSVPALSSIRRPPEVRLVDPGKSGKLEIHVEDQGGGVGRVFVTLNGSDISAQVAAACPELAKGGDCVVDLADLPTWKPGDENSLEAFASVADGAVRSRGTVREVVAEGQKVTDPPDLWVLAVGSGDYAADALDLQYAGFDARQFAKAITVAGERGFGADRTHVKVYSTDAGPDVAGKPGKDTLTEALGWMDSADPGDTFVLFLSGHGVSLTDGTTDDYFYVLPTAGAFDDLKTAAGRAESAWSGAQISEVLAKIPALKRVVILDTCAAGKLNVASLAAPRALSSDAVRAHARVQERTGAWFLAGAAADQVSYEASRYGDGVLTYSLLEGMRGPALDDASLLYVSRLFAHAEEAVPQYAAGIGGIQKPVIRTAEAGDFVLGELAQEDRSKVPLQAVKPVVVRARVVPVGGRADRLGVEAAVNAALREAGSGADAPFVVWDSDAADDTWQVTGTYTEKPGAIAFTGFVTRARGAETTEHPITAAGADASAVAAAVVEQVRAKVGS